MKPVESTPQSGPSPEPPESKAVAILGLSLPDLPEFPLDEDIVEAVADLPGPLPSSLQELADLVNAEARQLQAPAPEPAPMAPAAAPQPPQAVPMSSLPPERG